MEYYSLNHNAKNVSFLTAVRNGLAPDKGLYFPKDIPQLDTEFISNLPQLTNHEIALQVIRPFIGDDIPEKQLKKIIRDTLNFDFPLIKISESIAALELFHGPTLAFKDVGARFMARCLSYAYSLQNKEQLTVLVATSGDTGGAVADGFYKVKGINVVILYPKGKVSPLQEKQLTTLGENVSALEVEGTFDDCQEMVKSAFIDAELKSNIALTSANSINIARWLPQMFYYFFAYKNRPNPYKKLLISVPSGNFGNICAGLLAQKMGLPIEHFIASTNSNNTVSSFLDSGTYVPKKSIQTLSNAMDVGDPSNFIRIQKIFNNDFLKLKKRLTAYSYSDKETVNALKEIYSLSNYIAEPHGAIGYIGLKSFMDSQEKRENLQGIFLETAHPIKFSETVESALKTKINVPESLQELLRRKKSSIPISTYNQLKLFLLKN